MLEILTGPAARHDALTVFPLLSRQEARLPYQLLPDAIVGGAVRITEVDGGTVPQLLARNDGEQDVLILDGEQLVGARQNRTTSRSMILPARSEMKIPVSCMEQGRWHHVSPDFKPATYNSPAKVRRHSRRAEADRTAMGEQASPEALASAQGGVWSEIADTSAKLGVYSATSDLEAVYRERERDLTRWVAALPWTPGQVGLLAFLGDRPLGMDVLGDAGLYARVHVRFVSGYAMDALSDRGAGAPAAGAAERYLASVTSAHRSEAPTVGAGRYRVLSGPVIGAELTAGDRLVHLSAFPPLEPPRRAERDPEPFPPPSRRRRNR